MNAALLDKWDFLYSTDPLGTTIDQRKNANWLPADQITDWSQVTMIKMQQKPGNLFRQKDILNFYVPLDLPTNLPESTKPLSASASTAFSTNGNSYIESNKITFSFVPPYRVEGKVFRDQNNDGAMTDETGMGEYEIKLWNADGTPARNQAGEELKTTSDATGNFFFRVLQRGEYYLTLAKKVVSDSVSKLFENENGSREVGVGNDASVDGTDATNMTLKSTSFTLDPYLVTNPDNVYEKPSSFIATRNFGIVLNNGKINLKLTDNVDTTKILEG